MRPLLLPVLGLLLAASLAGCIGQSQTLTPTLGLPRAFDTSRGWSVPLDPPLYGLLEGVKAMVPSFDGVELSVGVFLPDKDGCDWAAAELPQDCKLATVMDGGPYYADRVAVDKFRPPTIEWLVPRGYAVVQMALRGTGESKGCMEYKSLKDIEDVSAVIDWIAAQPWSDGDVGMIGRSYDGSTAWAGAASGNPHLKAIVPISGASHAPLLYYKNGTAEGRALVHGITYWPNYGLGLTDRPDPTSRAPDWPDNLCREALLDVHAESLPPTVTGDAAAPYWQERNLQAKVLANYRGAVWVVHGLQDWNVNPSQSVPFIREMMDAGIPTKAWLGVWGHAYPDRVDEHRNVRWDWAQRTLEYFDFYLLGKGTQPRMDVEVEDSLFVWRSEQTYPPRDAVLTGWELSAGGALAKEGEAQAGSFVLAGDDPTSILNAAPLPAGGAAGVSGPGLDSAGPEAVFTSEPLEQDVRIAGLPQLALGVTPTTPVGGHVFAELFDIYPDGRAVRLSWAAMNLRFAAGGNTQPVELAPGQPITAMMEFEPTDAHIGQGHRLRLVVHRHGVEDILASPTMEPAELGLGGGASVLRLPLVVREDTLAGYRPPGMP